jgi:hypothetical protein
MAPIKTLDPNQLTDAQKNRQEILNRQLAGQDYYLGADGALATIGYVKAGTAFSATKIVRQ